MEISNCSLRQMEESIPKPENNKQINSNSAEEEKPLAFISSDYFLGSEPELVSENRKRKRKRRSRSLEKANRLAKNETIDNSSMVEKFGNNLLANATLTLAKVCFVNKFLFINKVFNSISFICSQVSK